MKCSFQIYWLGVEQEIWWTDVKVKDVVFLKYELLMVGSPTIMVFSISIAFQNLRKNERAFQGLKIQVHSNTEWEFDTFSRPYNQGITSQRNILIHTVLRKSKLPVV